MVTDSHGIDAAGIKAVETVIAKVERSTTAEIVPVVVLSSTGSGHVALTLFLLLFASWASIDIGLGLTSSLNDMVRIASETGIAFSVGLAAYWCARFAPVRRMLTSNEDLDTAVMRRAKLEFFEQKLTATRDATGILLFVSIMERRAVVLADTKIAVLLPPETWKDVVGLMLSGLKRGKAAEGLCAAIDACGQITSKHFPIVKGDVNELRNHLWLKN